MAVPAFRSVMDPSFRPTIMTPFDETGDRINRYLLRLTPSLDPIITRSLAIVRYGGDYGVASERRSIVPSIYGPEDPDTDEQNSGRDGSASADAPWKVIERGSFRDLLISALTDIQNVRTLERLGRADYKTPETLAQVILFGRADSPLLKQALEAVRAALDAAKEVLGATINLDAPILCVLADYDSSTDDRSFTDYARVSDTDWNIADDWPESNEPGEALRDLFLARANHSGAVADSEGAESAGATNGASDAYSDWRQRGDDLRQRGRRLQSQVMIRPRREQAPAAFQFLYSRLVQDRRAILTEEHVNYIMAEAVFALAATGLTTALSMNEILHSIQGVSAISDRLGSLGACLIRFPRGEAEAYCIASLGADLLDYWGLREDAMRRGGAHDQTDEMVNRAHTLVDTITDWLEHDWRARHWQDDWPTPGPDDGWPDLDQITDQTRGAHKALEKLNDDLDGLLAEDVIRRLVENLDSTGERHRRPERFGAHWKDVTDTQWNEFNDVRTYQWNPAVGSAYRTASDELNAYLDRRIDELWLDPELGWQAAGDFAKEMSDDLYKTTLNGFAEDRRDDAAEYERQLSDYEQMIREAYADIRTSPDDEDGSDDPQPYQPEFYTPTYRDDPNFFGNQPGGAQVHAPTYHSPNADPLMNGDPAESAAPDLDTQQSVTPGTVGVTPGTVGDEDTTAGGGPGNPDAADEPDDADPGAQPADTPPEVAAAPEPPSRQEREDTVVRGMADLVVKRQLDRRMVVPALGLSIFAMPTLTLLLVTLLTARWPLSFNLVASSFGLVTTALGVLTVTLWISARRRAEEALREHLDCLNLIGDRRRADVDERMRVFVVKQAQSNVQDMRDHLENWPQRIRNLAGEMRQDAQSVSAELFSGPAGYHDILIAYGVRLYPPDPPDPPTSQWDYLDAEERAVESPLQTIYRHFSEERTHSPVQPWQASLDGILDELRAGFRSGQSIVRMNDDRFRALLKQFLYARFRIYLSSEMGQLTRALDSRDNPAAAQIWREAYEHAEPPHGAPGADLLYIAGQAQTLAVSTELGDAAATQRIVTRAITRHKEWLLIARLRRGEMLP